MGSTWWARDRCHLSFKGVHDRFGIPVDDGQQDAGGTIRDAPALFPVLHVRSGEGYPVFRHLADLRVEAFPSVPNLPFPRMAGIPPIIRQPLHSLPRDAFLETPRRLRT